MDEEVVEARVEGGRDEEDVRPRPVDFCCSLSGGKRGSKGEARGHLPCACKYFFIDSNQTYPRPPGIR